MAKLPDEFLLLITRMSCTKSPKPATEGLAWLHLLSTYTFRLSWSCSRSESDQKHAAAVNIFVHEGNHFLITGEVKQSTDCHYTLTRSLVCKWLEKKNNKKKHTTFFGIIISAASPKWGSGGPKPKIWQSVPNGTSRGDLEALSHSMIGTTGFIFFFTKRSKSYI